MTLHHMPVPQAPEDAAMRAMFAARKRVFIDLLGWDLPVLAGQYEIDAFDTPGAAYIILLGRGGQHRASARLLPSTLPHLLAGLYPHLCETEVPIGETIWEISRFCVDPGQDAEERRAARNELVSALADYALDRGISDYVGIAEQRWFEKIMTFGWRCEALGAPAGGGGAALRALRIRIDANMISGLERTGIYIPPEARAGAREMVR